MKDIIIWLLISFLKLIGITLAFVAMIYVTLWLIAMTIGLPPQRVPLILGQ